MYKPPAANLSQPQSHSPFTAEWTAACGSLLLWTCTLLLTLATLACRFILWSAWTVLRLSGATLVYLFLTAVLLLAVLLMLAFHSVAFINSNFP